MSRTLFTIEADRRMAIPVTWDDIFMMLDASWPLANLNDDDLDNLSTLLVERLADIDVLKKIRMDDGL
jgi:hypothetical protein